MCRRAGAPRRAWCVSPHRDRSNAWAPRPAHDCDRAHIHAHSAPACPPSLLQIDPSRLSTTEQELHTRVNMIEDTLRMCKSEISGIRDDLQLLPALCEKLGIAHEDLEEY